MISSNLKPSIRSLLWSSNAFYSNKPPENVDSSKTTAKKSSQSNEQQQTVAGTKEQDIKAADVKIVFDNIKEQSLKKEPAGDTLKQIKDKIFDRKPKDVEQEKGRLLFFRSTKSNRKIGWSSMANSI